VYIIFDNIYSEIDARGPESLLDLYAHVYSYLTRLISRVILADGYSKVSMCLVTVGAGIGDMYVCMCMAHICVVGVPMGMRWDV